MKNRPLNLGGIERSAVLEASDFTDFWQRCCPVVLAEVTPEIDFRCIALLLVVRGSLCLAESATVSHSGRQ